MLVLLKTVFPESIISLSRAKSVVMVSPLKSFYWKVWTESSKFLSVWWTWASHVIVCSAWHQAHTINVTTVLGYEKTRLKFAFYCEKFLSYNSKFVRQFEVIVKLSSNVIVKLSSNERIQGKKETVAADLIRKQLFLSNYFEI